MPQLTRPRLLKQEESEPTRQQIEMARINQSWREYRSPNSDVSGEGWKPANDNAENPLDVYTVRGYLVLKVDAPISRLRRLIRWIRGIR